MTKRIEQTMTPGQALFAKQGLAGRFDSSVNIRFAIHLAAAEIFAESPIWGHGFASFPAQASEHGAKHGLWGAGTVASESILLNTAVEAGLLGLVIYGWLFWSLASPALKMIREGSRERELAIGFIAIFAAILAVSLTQIGLFLPEISLGFWLMAGMVLRAANYERAA
jgi:O-antigen ligase